MVAPRVLLAGAAPGTGDLVLDHMDPLAPLEVDRQAPWIMVSHVSRDVPYLGFEPRGGRVQKFFVPVKDDGVPTEKEWVDAVASSPGFGAGVDMAKAFVESGTKFVPSHSLAEPVIERGSFGDGVWTESDRHIALLWMALRRGLARDVSTSLHDGTVMLVMDGGIVAELRVSVLGDANDDVTAAVEIDVMYGRHSGLGLDKWKTGPLTRPVKYHKTQGFGGQPIPFGEGLPRSVFLSGRGWRVDVTFSTSPFFMS